MSIRVIPRCVIAGIIGAYFIISCTAFAAHFPIVPMAKQSLALASESVEITNDAPHVDILGYFDCFSKIVSGRFRNFLERKTVFCPSNSNSFWRNDYASLCWFRNRKRLFLSVLRKAHVNKPTKLTGWKITSVYKSHPAYQTVSFNRQNNPSWLYRNVRSLKNSGIPILLNSDPPKSAGNKDQQARKNSYVNVSNFEIAIVSLRPLIFFCFGIGITIIGYLLQSPRKQNSKWLQFAGLIMGWCGPLVFVYGFWGLL